MKNNLVITFLFICGLLQAQDLNDRERNHQLALSVVQDGRLSIMRDGHGNVPFTTDISIKLELRSYSTPIGYYSIIPVFEYADLEGGGYMSYGVLGGYTFDEWIYLPTFGLLNHDIDIDITPYFGLSKIHRKWGNKSTYQLFKESVTLGLELTFKVHHNLGIVFDSKFIDRNDLEWRYGTKGLKFNFGVGIKYEFSIIENKRQNSKIRYRGFN